MTGAAGRGRPEVRNGEHGLVLHNPPLEAVTAIIRAAAVIDRTRDRRWLGEDKPCPACLGEFDPLGADGGRADREVIVAAGRAYRAQAEAADLALDAARRALSRPAATATAAHRLPAGLVRAGRDGTLAGHAAERSA